MALDHNRKVDFLDSLYELAKTGTDEKVVDEARRILDYFVDGEQKEDHFMALEDDVATEIYSSGFTRGDLDRVCDTLSLMVNLKILNKNDGCYSLNI